MTRMTGPDCAVMCNLINIHTYIHTYIHTDTRLRSAEEVVPGKIRQSSISGLFEDKTIRAQFE